MPAAVVTDTPTGPGAEEGGAVAVIWPSEPTE